MPTPTYTPLATVTLASSASSVSFSNIPASYRDLILVLEGTATTGGAVWLRYNGDSGSNYSRVGMAGNGSSAASFSDSSQTFTYLGLWRTDKSFIQLQVMDYSATDKHKTGLVRGGIASAETVAVAHRWANTAAITSLLVQVDSGQIASGTIASLYGIVS